jgi:hypothetical protein
MPKGWKAVQNKETAMYNAHSIRPYMIVNMNDKLLVNPNVFLPKT